VQEQAEDVALAGEGNTPAQDGQEG
jgi:hypothetical protein